MNDFGYGEYMHYHNAKMLAEFGKAMLLDLQSAGILGQSFVVKLDLGDRDKRTEEKS